MPLVPLKSSQKFRFNEIYFMSFEHKMGESRAIEFLSDFHY